ncbi:tyrosine-type recombinase/integrase [Spirillospora sp. CA-128828]|uniref:tyrosine-type recombinase/integrase n=1 Tax=Spirillospora sp. CA-128828 TaxID=3240033 RepID=UPI003D8F1CA1
MAVYDRWHTRKPRTDPKTGKPVGACGKHSTKATELYPSAAHGRGARWQVRWYDLGGKQCSENFDRKEGKNPELHAEAYWAKVQHELKADTYIDPSAGEVSLKDYAEQLIEFRTLNGTSRENMRQALAKHVYPVIGGIELKTLSRTPSLVQAVVARMTKAKLDPVTIGTVMTHLGTVINCAIDDEKITKNPLKSKVVVIPKAPKRKIVPWTRAQIAAQRDALPGRYKTMVDAGAGLGLRQGEVFGLAPDDVEWLKTRPKVHVRRQVKVMKNAEGKWVLVFAAPKYDKTRTVRLSESVKQVLAEHIQRYPPLKVTLPWGDPEGDSVTVELIFTSGPVEREDGKKVRLPKAGALHRSWFSRCIWKPAAIKAGIVDPAKEREPDAPPRDHNGMHALRHWFASVLLAGGEGIPAVSEWMGHSSPSITLDRYGHLLPDNEDRMTGLIDEALKPDHEQGALDVHSHDHRESR